MGKIGFSSPPPKGRKFDEVDRVMNSASRPPGRPTNNLIASMAEYWHTPLGRFYRHFPHRLAVYLLVGLAYILGTFISLITFIGPSWVYANIAVVAAKSLHTTLVFTLSLILVDVSANRFGPSMAGYPHRTVGRQWLVMAFGFLLGFSFFRAYYYTFIGLYASWAVSYYQNFPEVRLSLPTEFFYYLVGWLITAALVIQFALRSQRLAEKSRKPALDDIADSGQTAGADSGQTREPDLGQAPPEHFIHTGSNLHLEIPFTDITHVSVEDHYCRLSHKNGDGVASHILRIPLTQLDDTLPNRQFARIHRSHIVNLDHVLGWRMVNQQRRLVMDHGIDELPISRHRFRELNHIIKPLKRYKSVPRQNHANEQPSSG